MARLIRSNRLNRVDAGCAQRGKERGEDADAEQQQRRDRECSGIMRINPEDEPLSHLECRQRQ